MGPGQGGGPRPSLRSPNGKTREPDDEPLDPRSQSGEWGPLGWNIGVIPSLYISDENGGGAGCSAGRARVRCVRAGYVLLPSHRDLQQEDARLLLQVKVRLHESTALANACPLRLFSARERSEGRAAKYISTRWRRGTGGGRPAHEGEPHTLHSPSTLLPFTQSTSLLVILTVIGLLCAGEQF